MALGDGGPQEARERGGPGVCGVGLLPGGDVGRGLGRWGVGWTGGAGWELVCVCGRGEWAREYGGK